MKKIKISIVLGIFAFATLAPANTFAQNPETTGQVLDRFQSRQDALQDRRSDIRLEAASTTTEIRNAIQTKRGDLQERVDSRKTDLTQRLEERKRNIQERRAELSEKTKERVGNNLDTIFKRFYNSITKLDDFSNRIQEKINEKSDNGEDISSLQNLLDTANSEIANAYTEVEAAEETLNEAVDSSLGSGDVRDLVIVAKDSIKNAHQALVEVVRNLD